MPDSPYLVDSLVENVRTRCMLPSSDESYSTARLLQLMNDEQGTFVAKLLMSPREEYLGTYEDQTTSSGKAKYRVPKRAIGNKIKFAAIVDGEGKAPPLKRIEPERRHEYALSGTPEAYMFNGSYVELVPAPTGTQTLRIFYFQRPNRLVESTAAGIITDIDTGTGEVTVEAVPETGTFTDDVTYDLVRGTPGFECMALDLAASDVTGDVLTFDASDLPDDLAVGDYVCLAGETPIPQLPVEIHALLAQRAVVKALEAAGDPKVKFAKEDLKEMYQDAKSLLSPRAEGTPRKVINRNGPGW